MLSPALRRRTGPRLCHCSLLAARGANISITDIKKAELETAAKTIREELPEVGVIAAVVDVSESAAVDEWIKNTVSKFGKLDGAANNAGILHRPKPIRELTDDLWDCILKTNLTGVMNCLRAELRVIEKGGSVVNTSSVAGVYGFQGLTAYAASKHGAIGLTKSVAKEMGADNIGVNPIYPGTVATKVMDEAAEVLKGNEIPAVLKRVAAPEEIASTVAFLLGHDSSYITGQAYVVDGS
ncbi:3-oxoacyl-reductase [Glonium stellatum]|uniref:3-oxoacyl-reductase n=1 Tax=Glonium stellatum TaxID=574774 RepID=A0A8E2JND9_9PEZI|nr:3-oxoacyl-reductase [Glonium stellatum]